MRHPDLDVDGSRLAQWNKPERRRHNFRNLHLIHRRGLTFRALEILKLEERAKPSLAGATDLTELTSRRSFCGLCVVQGTNILLEHCALDFSPHSFHSIQSITKTLIPLLLGYSVAVGTCKLDTRIGSIVPDVGPAYREATIQDALDMNISNNFSEDYVAPYSPAPAKGEPVGYAREEIAMGWRLPPQGESEFGVREFAMQLQPTAAPAKPVTQYKSANTDVLGWAVEALSGEGLASQINSIIAAAGLEHAFHMSADCRGVPVLSGGGVMTLRDLARLGLLMARDTGIDGRAIRMSSLAMDAMSGRGTIYRNRPTELRYRNHLLSHPGRWFGHPGYAGQFLMVSPEKQAAIAFFSVLETPYGDEGGYFDSVMAALGHVLEAI